MPRASGASEIELEQSASVSLSANASVADLGCAFVMVHAEAELVQLTRTLLQRDVCMPLSEFRRRLADPSTFDLEQKTIDELKAQLETMNDQLKEYIRDAAPSSALRFSYRVLDPALPYACSPSQSRARPFVPETAREPFQSQRDQEEATRTAGGVRGLNPADDERSSRLLRRPTPTIADREIILAAALHETAL